MAKTATKGFHDGKALNSLLLVLNAGGYVKLRAYTHEERAFFFMTRLVAQDEIYFRITSEGRRFVGWLLDPHAA